MKRLMVALLSILGVSCVAQALTVEFYWLGSDKLPFASTTYRLDRSRSVGAITVEYLSRMGATFQGSEDGISSINKRGGELEVISDRRMRAYGWCYTVNGTLATVTPGQAMLDPATYANATIRWFYAYAAYDSGNWLAYCVPADHFPKPNP